MSRGTIFHADRPDAPVDVKLTCDPREITVVWDAGHENNDPIIKFSIFYTSAAGDDEQEGPQTSDGTTFTTSFEAQPWTEYSVVVIAENSVGQSERSETVSCKTKSAPPPRNPGKVCVENGASDELIVVWTVKTYDNSQLNDIAS